MLQMKRGSQSLECLDRAWVMILSPTGPVGDGCLCHYNDAVGNMMGQSFYHMPT